MYINIQVNGSKFFDIRNTRVVWYALKKNRSLKIETIVYANSFGLLFFGGRCAQVRLKCLRKSLQLQICRYFQSLGYWMSALGKATCKVDFAYSISVSSFSEISFIWYESNFWANIFWHDSYVWKYFDCITKQGSFIHRIWYKYFVLLKNQSIRSSVSPICLSVINWKLLISPSTKR